MTTRMKKRLPLLTISTFALLLVVGAAGCAKKEEPGVATANPSAGTASGPAGNGQQSALKYSQCMRDQGMTWFPDPGADGGLHVSAPEGTDQAKLDAAEAACKKYMPTGGQGGQISDEDVNKIRQMAQCVRDHGFPKYPDPDSNGSIQIDEGTTGISPDDPKFQAAMKECQKYMPPRQNGSSS